MLAHGLCAGAQLLSWVDQLIVQGISSCAGAWLSADCVCVNCVRGVLLCKRMAAVLVHGCCARIDCVRCCLLCWRMGAVLVLNV